MGLLKNTSSSAHGGLSWLIGMQNSRLFGVQENADPIIGRKHWHERKSAAVLLHVA